MIQNPDLVIYYCLDLFDIFTFRFFTLTMMAYVFIVIMALQIADAENLEGVGGQSKNLLKLICSSEVPSDAPICKVN